MPSGGLGLFISQSGETIDTLEALRYAKRSGQKILSLVNVAESAIARESHAILQTLAGPEIGSSEEHTSELQSLMRTSYAVFCLKKKNIHSNFANNRENHD